MGDLNNFVGVVGGTIICLELIVLLLVGVAINGAPGIRSLVALETYAMLRTTRSPGPRTRLITWLTEG